MAEGIGISTIRAILNKIPSPEIEAKLKKEVEQKQIKVAGAVYLDPQVSQAGLMGQELPADTGAHGQVKKIVTAILSGQE
jgi:CO dehydrogenase nickel-insertion accessory protein CooC1